MMMTFTRYPFFYQSQRAAGPEQRRRPRQPTASATAAAAAAATAAAGGGRERQRGSLHPPDPDEPLGSSAAAGDDPRPHCQRHAAVSAAVAVTVPTGGPFSFMANQLTDENSLVKSAFTVYQMILVCFLHHVCCARLPFSWSSTGTRSVADPGCLSRILIFIHPGSNISNKR
jgi:hypothetical protein